MRYRDVQFLCAVARLLLSPVAVVLLPYRSEAQQPSPTPTDSAAGGAQPEVGTRRVSSAARDSARQLDAAGARMAQAGRYTDALALWRHAAQIAPDDQAAHFNAGMMFELTRHAADALREFQVAYRLKPDQHILYHLGVSFYNVGMPDSALKWFLAATATDRKDVASWGYAGFTASGLGRDSAAIVYWQRALELNRHYFEKAEPQQRERYEHSLQVLAARRDSTAPR